MKRYIAIVLLSVLVLKFYQEGNKYRKQAKDLQYQIYDIPFYKQRIWEDACKRGVDRACYWGECAVVSLDEIKMRECNPPPAEEL